MVSRFIFAFLAAIIVSIGDARAVTATFAFADGASVAGTITFEGNPVLQSNGRYYLSGLTASLTAPTMNEHPSGLDTWVYGTGGSVRIRRDADYFGYDVIYDVSLDAAPTYVNGDLYGAVGWSIYFLFADAEALSGTGFALPISVTTGPNFGEFLRPTYGQVSRLENITPVATVPLAPSGLLLLAGLGALAVTRQWKRRATPPLSAPS